MVLSGLVCEKEKPFGIDELNILGLLKIFELLLLSIGRFLDPVSEMRWVSNLELESIWSGCFSSGIVTSFKEVYGCS